MRRTVILFWYLLIIMCFTTIHVTAQSCQGLSGTWVNQDSSLLHIGEGQGQFSGYYASIASGDTARYDLFGVVNHAMAPTTFSFTVNWGDYGSITSWTGYCRETDQGPELVTMWHLVRPYVEDDWARFVTNQSIFIPYKP